MADKKQGGRDDRSKGGDMNRGGQGGMQGAGSDQKRDDMNRAGRGQGMGSGSRTGGSGRDDTARR